MEFSLGLIEVSSLGHAIAMLDDMVKVADVEFVAVERKLGGRLVTIVIRGTVSAVTASIEAGKRIANAMDCLKAAEVIARPHPEILKFLHLEEKSVDVNSESAATHTGPVPAKKAEKKAPAKKTTGRKTTGTRRSKAKDSLDK